MTEKKITLGQQFLKLLEQSAGDKKQLLALAAALIKRSPSHRGLEERKLPDDPTAIRMMAAAAKLNARLGRDVSTDGMLAMVMEAYGDPKKFKEAFAQKHPQEYAKLNPIPKLIKKDRER
ncbi:MAG: hypothetical protein IJ852_00395 [Alphaproteobacteria bacterium]|nr:hypothetical protein [Alphaproteobacteria bacterium]